MNLEIRESRRNTIINGLTIKRRGRHDGSSIWKTKDCINCPYKLDLGENEMSFSLCLWGVAWKIISEKQERLRLCDKKAKPARNFFGIEEWKKYYLYE